MDGYLLKRLAWRFSKVPAMDLERNSKVLRHVKTRHMYERCKNYYAYDFHGYCRFWNIYMDHFGYNKTGVGKIEVHYTQGPAMENLWLDELENLAKYPIAWASAAVVGGHLPLLQYLVAEYGVELTRLNYIGGRYHFAMDTAAKYGDLDMIKYLHAAGNQACTTDAIDYAAANGHFDTVKWLCENRTEGWTSQALRKAITNDHLDIVKYLAHRRSEVIDDDTMLAAINKRNFGLVKLFHEAYNTVVTWRAVEFAIYRDYLEIAKYCIKCCTERRSSWIITKAAREGRLDLLQLLHENRTIPWTKVDTTAPSIMDFLGIPKKLRLERLEGCTTEAMDEAATQGRLDIVQLLHENRTEGCTTKAMDNAAAAGRLDIVKYLHENRTEGCTKRAYDAAARNRHFDVVQFLLENREESSDTKAMIRAGFRHKTAIVQYLHEHGHQGFTPETIDIAASMGHMDTIRYLLEHRKEGFTFMAIFWAAARGYNDILKYLLSHDREGIYLKKALEKANHDRHCKAMKLKY